MPRTTGWHETGMWVLLPVHFIHGALCFRVQHTCVAPGWTWQGWLSLCHHMHACQSLQPCAPSWHLPSHLTCPTCLLLRYTQALHLCTRSTDHLQKATTSSTQAPSPTSYHDRQEAKLLLCNRSLVELLAGHPQAALADAEAALALAPAWPKAHWRVGKAAAALGYWPQAVQAYLYAWRLTTGEWGGRR